MDFTERARQAGIRMKTNNPTHPPPKKKQDNIFSWIGTLCFGNPVKSLALLSVFILALAGRQTCFSEEPKCGLAVLRCKYTWEHMHQFHKKLKWNHLLHPASNYSGQHFSVQGDLISWHSLRMHMMRWLDVKQISIIVWMETLKAKYHTNLLIILRSFFGAIKHSN